jgi:hypothetical protein
MKTEQLIQELKKHSNLKIGRESIGADGVRYRYDSYMLKYPHAANWMVRLFQSAAEENGVPRYATQFFVGEKYSLAHDRPPFKGQGNGKMSMSELIIL